jgi:hypothetical protein
VTNIKDVQTLQQQNFLFIIPIIFGLFILLFMIINSSVNFLQKKRKQTHTTHHPFPAPTSDMGRITGKKKITCSIHSKIIDLLYFS